MRFKLPQGITRKRLYYMTMKAIEHPHIFFTGFLLGSGLFWLGVLSAVLYIIRQIIADYNYWRAFDEAEKYTRKKLEAIIREEAQKEVIREMRLEP